MPTVEDARRRMDEALEAIRRDLAAVQAALEEERRKRMAVEATQQRTTEARSEVAERAAESAGAADGALGLSPLVGFTGADVRAGLRQLAGKGREVRCVEHDDLVIDTHRVTQSGDRVCRSMQPMPRWCETRRRAQRSGS